MTTRNTEHAEMLADVAHQVVESYRGQCKCDLATGIFDHPAEGICRGVVGEFWQAPEPTVHVSWSYTLDEKHQD